MSLLLVNGVLWVDFNWSKVYSKTSHYKLKFLEDLLQDSGSFVEFFEKLFQDSTHLILCIVITPVIVLGIWIRY